MLRRVCCALAATLAVAFLPQRLHAQAWGDSTVRALVERAIARRLTQIGDTAIASYVAKAHGYVTFLAQVGDTALLPAKVVKSTELAVDLYWRAPNSSRQVVVGLRDTTLLPSDINYYRDRYGIVQGNFPDRIRLGEAHDVSDVPHPLSAAGLDAYEFSSRDSLFLSMGGARIALDAVAFRPKDSRLPRGVGILYLEREHADVVRLELTFTQSAILDKRIEKLSVVLENALVQGRFWLPRRQELEVQRAATWLDFPVRGIIRGRWEVCCYDISAAPPTKWPSITGQEISFAPAAELAKYPFEGTVLDSLRIGEVSATTADAVRAQALARELVARRFLDRRRPLSFGVSSASDVVRVNRAEGLAIGAGVLTSPVPGYTLRATARYGTDDHVLKSNVSLTLEPLTSHSLRLYGSRMYRDAGDVEEASGARNSLQAQEFGVDFTDPYDVTAFGAELTLGHIAGLRWRIDGAHESQRPLAVRGTPVSGTYERLIPALRLEGWRASLLADGGRWTLASSAIQARGELRSGWFDTPGANPASSNFLRGSVAAHITRALPAGTLQLESFGAILSHSAANAPQQLVYLGGPLSGPGYAYHELSGRAGFSQRVEWQQEIPFVSVALGTYGKTSGRAVLCPFVHTVWIDRDAVSLTRRSGWYPSLGMGLEVLSGLARIDVAHGLRNGQLTFGVDVSRDFWPIL